MKFLDAHTHVQFVAYDLDRDEVLKRAKDAGVGIINVGTELQTSESAVNLAHKHENIWAVVGMHPTHASGSEHHDKKELKKPPKAEGEKFDYESFKRLATDPKVLAIGECGLDYFRVGSDKQQETREKQKEVFLKQIELAREVKKPLMIHCRSAFGDLIDVFKSERKNLNSPPGIIHFFTGTIGDAKKLLDLGFYFTFGGVITFVRDYDEIIRSIPIGRILSETDAPYVTPVPYRGKRNEPVYVIEVVKKLAELKNLSVDAMAEKILENAREILNLKPATS